VDAPIPAIQEFGKKYEAKFKSKPDHNGVKGYIAPYMIKAAAEKAGKLDPKAIAAALHGMTITPDKVPGILIEATWDDTGEIDRISFLGEVKDGKQFITETWPKLKKWTWCSGGPRTAGVSSAMPDFLQLLISGLATGAIYALAAIGFTLLWQTSQTINFAQGEFVMLPAFFALAGMKWLGLPFSLAALLAITLAMLMLGLVFKAIIVDPLIRQGVLPLVISTIALAIFLKDGVKDLYSAEAQPFPTILP